MILPRHCQAPGCTQLLPADLPWNARYCSTRCRKAADLVRRRQESVAASPRPPDKAGEATNAQPPNQDAFQRLQGDAVLSDWKPHSTPDTNIPDIPNFLRRTPEQRKEG